MFQDRITPAFRQLCCHAPAMPPPSKRRVTKKESYCVVPIVITDSLLTQSLSLFPGEAVWRGTGALTRYNSRVSMLCCYIICKFAPWREHLQHVEFWAQSSHFRWPTPPVARLEYASARKKMQRVRTNHAQTPIMWHIEWHHEIN